MASDRSALLMNLAKGLGLVAGIAAIYYFTSDSYGRSSASDETLRACINEFVEKVYPMFFNIAGTVEKSKSRAAAMNIDPQMLQMQIMHQFMPAINMLRDDILAKHKCTESDFEYIMTNLGERDEVVGAILSELEEIQAVAMSGDLPVVSSYIHDEAFSTEILLQIISKNKEGKIELLKEAMTRFPKDFASGMPSPDVIEMQMKRAEQLELDTLKEFGFEGDAIRTKYYKAIAYHQKNTPEFKKQRDEFEAEQMSRTAELLKPKPSFKMAAEVAEQAGVVARVSGDDLDALVSSSLEDNANVVILVVGEEDEASAVALAEYSRNAKLLSTDVTGHVALNYFWITHAEALALHASEESEARALGNAAQELKEAPFYFSVSSFNGRHEMSYSTWTEVRGACLAGIEQENQMD